jgi:L-alanine-DL-glutamate epimerase-like enolase superfamily enzyme
MVDESIFSEYDLINLIRQGFINMLFLKIDKLGGLRPARRIMNIAEASRIICVPGGMHNTSIGTAALAHLFACNNTILPGGFQGPIILSDDPCKNSKEMFKDSCFVLPQDPGLGVVLDNEAIKDLKVSILG